MTDDACDYRVFDADNHYYEAPDAYTRHIDPAMAKRAMQWADIDGRRRLLVGGKVNRFIPNPLFDPVAKPGSLDEYFRGKNPEAKDMRALFGELEPIRPEYRDREARLRVMDEQGLDGCFLFPTLGVGMEEALADDPPALMAAFAAFNRWLEDDWGYAYRERIFAAPMLSLADVDAAVAELTRVLEADARIVCVKGGPAHTPTGLTSPADRRFDPFWALVDEAGVTVGIHSGDAGYGRYLADWEPTGDFEAFRYVPPARRPGRRSAALRDHGGARLPRVVRPLPAHPGGVASRPARPGCIPCSRSWPRRTVRCPRASPSDPVETLRAHVWVAPFYEDDLGSLKDDLGLDHLLFGSDWPHAEGLADPRTFAEDLRRHDYTDQEIRTVMAENGPPLTRRL